MKKILAVICFSFLSISFANAGILTLGLSGNASLLSVDGKETIKGTTNAGFDWNEGKNARAATDNAATTESTSDDLAIAYITLFGELELFDTGLRVGLSYVPYALESETTENNRNDNCSQIEGHENDPVASQTCVQTTSKVGVDLEDLVTMYVAYHHDLDIPFISSVFIKAGMIEADVITRENLTSGSQYGNTSLSGDFFGLGVEKEFNEQGMFVRLEGNITEFDTIKLVNTNSENSNTIDITGMDGASALISVGKTF
tara:strand:+ start:320 stop:1093 length:774 start_codon:yes stop_codon:yes gene_type:complete